LRTTYAGEKGKEDNVEDTDSLWITDVEENSVTGTE
jgi:hypothetical protein